MNGHWWTLTDSDLSFVYDLRFIIVDDRINLSFIMIEMNLFISTELSVVNKSGYNWY